MDIKTWFFLRDTRRQYVNQVIKKNTPPINVIFKFLFHFISIKNRASSEKPIFFGATVFNAII